MNNGICSKKNTKGKKSHNNFGKLLRVYLTIQKNRSSDIVALLRGWKQVEKATQSAYNAEGSAMEEYSIHLDTVQASLNTLSSTWQEFSNIFLNSKFLKSGIDTLSNLLDLLGELIDSFGVLPTLLGGLSIVGSFKNKGFFKLIEDDATKSGKRIENAFFNTFTYHITKRLLFRSNIYRSVDRSFIS